MARVGKLVGVGIIGVMLMVVLLACQSGTASNTPAGGAAAPAGKTWAWKYEGPLAENDRVSVNYITPFLNYIEKNSNGRIKVDRYWSASLGFGTSKLLEGLEKGLLDSGDVSVSGSSGSFPLGDVMDLPGLAPQDPAQKQEVMTSVVAPAWQTEITKRNVLLLNPVGLESRNVYCKQPISALSDLKGLKIRSLSGLESTLTEALGATPVTMQTGDVYTGLQSGVLDCYWLTHGGSVSSKYYEVTKFGYEIGASGVVSSNAVSKGSFDSLPADLQKVVRDAGEAAAKNWITAYPKIDGDARQELIAKGMKMTAPNSADTAKILDAEKKLWAVWADKKGASTAAYKALVEKIQNAKPVK